MTKAYNKNDNMKLFLCLYCASKKFCRQNHQLFFSSKGRVEVSKRFA